MSEPELNRRQTDQADAIRLSKAILRLDTKILGLVLGLVFGLSIFLMTNWLVLAGGHVGESGERITGPNLALLGQFFIGYRVSFFGSLVGFLYGFALGTITGSITGRLYNWLSSFRRPPDSGAGREAR